MSYTFVRELIDSGKVPPEHLGLPSKYDQTPMNEAWFRDTRHGMPIVKLLVLRGVLVRPQDFRNPSLSGILRERIEGLIEWANADLAIRDTFLELVLGCGVHGGRDLPPARRSQLMKLRGDGNTDARQRIASCLGVRVGVEVGRLRRAVMVWREVEGGTAVQAGQWAAKMGRHPLRAKRASR